MIDLVLIKGEWKRLFIINYWKENEKLRKCWDVSKMMIINCLLSLMRLSSEGENIFVVVQWESWV